MNVVRRSPRAFLGYTTGDGFKKPGTPAFWPFGMSLEVRRKSAAGEARKNKLKAILRMATED